MNPEADGLQPDPWTRLSAFTGARIALGRAGISLPTRAHLEFQLAHARAKDAVRLPLDMAALEADLHAAGLAILRLETLATSRRDYLQHPDRGRRLAAQSVDRIRSHMPGESADMALVVADGLSSIAIQRHAPAFLSAFLPMMVQRGYTCSPIIIVQQGRVAVADEVAEIMKCRMAAILIGERPGLSTPDSMGVYFTFKPHVGCRDALRNCISNIHGSGLSYRQAAVKLIYLVTEADRLGLSGVELKDVSPTSSPTQALESNFLLD